MAKEKSGSGAPDGRWETTESELSGRAQDVVQARDISGGVHFHGSAARTPAVPRQLPGDVRGFVNRSADLDRLDLILATETESRLSPVCVIVGTAGVGKTSFAVHWAHKVLDRFPDGQLYVNLRGYDPGRPISAEQALERFLAALEVPRAAIPTDLEARAGIYRSQLAGRRMLVVLDNASSVGQVRPLLPGSPGCLVLVTSRSRLSGLVAREGARRLSLDMLDEPEAIALIRGLVGDYRPEDDLAEVAELAQLCARLPLALRIAAERAACRPRMPLRELIADLRDESALWDALTTGDDEESDAVRSVFAWSYRALTEDAGRLFRLLGLHPGPDFGAEVAAELAGIPVSRARRLLDDLAGAHLLEQLSARRYQFHDLLRAYAIDQVRLEESPEARQEALRRALLWYLRRAAAMVRAVAPRTASVPLAGDDESFSDHATAMVWYEQERPNLLAAVRGAAEAQFSDIAWQLATCLHRVYARLNHFDDWRVTGDIALPAVRAVGGPADEAMVLESVAKMHTQSGSLPEGVRFHRAALDIRRATADVAGEIASLNGIGLAVLRAHRLAEARAHFEQTLELAVRFGDREWEGIAANNLAYALAELEDYEAAKAAHQRALAIYRELGDRGAEGDALRCASQILRGAGNPAEALFAIETALGIAQEFDNRAWEAWWLVEFGRVQVALGRVDDAIDSYHRAAVAQRRIGDRGREAVALDATGEAYRLRGQHKEAIDFHLRASAVFRELGDHWALAGALVNLADAVAESGDPAAADEHARSALTALDDFTDPAARRLRERSRARISG
ncbi:ATP-binding protein [Allokutzneria albata]|uniref:NB-ARC domain-containing protein n=1 Tax=Allokutzneria albata TaxID=211114 RepID=A0A1G9WID0_ALLAB|nr:tetratricopeptide repeat protein [Allokutzneria albata]SDM84013.1 NB-ARC domain-containing protein [Allokutzneria albata]